MQIGTWTSPLHSQDHFNAPDDAVGFMHISGANIQHEAPGVPSPMEFWSGDVCERLALTSSPLPNRHIVFHGLSETGVGTRSFTLLKCRILGLRPHQVHPHDAILDSGQTSRSCSTHASALGPAITSLLNFC